MQETETPRDEMAETPQGETPAEQEQITFPEPKPVSVEIFDQVYRLRGPDPEYLKGLAAMVDSKMRAVAANGATVDTLRVAVLASLNIADEMARMQQRYDMMAGSVEQTEQGIRSRAGELTELLDAVLEERKAS
jgi:cell division protein ZapA